MKEILITGGAGYIGSVLCKNLVELGYRITCLDNLMFNKDSIIELLKYKNFHFVNLDINDWVQMRLLLKSKKFDAVLHLASIVGDPACKLYDELAIKTNWDSSKWLIDECRAIKIPRFIFASTCSNYGKMNNSEDYVNEDSSLSPVSLYAELKVKVEDYILNEIDKSEQFSPTCLRFSTVYGLSPRMRFDLTVNEFVKELSLSKPLEIYGEQFWRPYCHVNDFANAYSCVLNSDKDKIAYEVFNVGNTSENYTKKMIITEIEKVLPNISIKYVSKFEDPRDYRVDFSKIKDDLGFISKYTVKDGILEIKEAILNNKFINPEDQIYYNIPHSS